MTHEEALHLLTKFAAAWNAHDVAALLSCMTEDGTFYAAAGPAPGGAQSSGVEALRRSYSDIFAAFPDARWRDAKHFLVGDRAVTEWTFEGTKADGTAVRVRGCDVFVLRDGKIAVKDTFRKAVL
jgi:ketosteroid isomerase-like protein